MQTNKKLITDLNKLLRKWERDEDEWGDNEGCAATGYCRTELIEVLEKYGCLRKEK